MLLGTAFGQLHLQPWQVAYAIAYPIVCLIGLYLAARAMFVRHVVRSAGA